jgi:hypothetical protein
LQGEGQEFESPRLHQPSFPRRSHRNRIRTIKVPSTARESWTDADRTPVIDPLIRVLPPPAGHRPADRWATKASAVVVRFALTGGPHLNNWNVFGRLKIFDFAE